MLKTSAAQEPQFGSDTPVGEVRGVRAIAAEMIYAAADGDLPAIQRLHALGTRLDVADYDYRTPLHLAAAEGHEEVVRFFVECDVERAPRDRWGNSPEQDARRHGHWHVAQLLAGPRAKHEREPQPAVRRGEAGVFRCIE